MCAFVTFASQEGFERARRITGEVNWDGKVTGTDRTFLDEPFFFESAPEPSNIIWENRHLTKK